MPTTPGANARKAIPLTAVALIGVASLGVASQQIFSVDQLQHNASGPSYYKAPSNNTVPASAFKTLLARTNVSSTYDCVNASDASTNGISAINCKQRTETGSPEGSGFVLTIFNSSDPVYSESYAGQRLTTVYDAKKRAAQRVGHDTQVPSRDDIAANFQLFSLDEFTGTCEGEGNSCARGAQDFGTTMYPFRQSSAYQRLVASQGARPSSDAERRSLDRLNDLTNRLDAQGVTCDAPRLGNGVAYADCPNVGRLVVDTSDKKPAPAGSNVIAGGGWYFEGANNATDRSVKVVKDLATSTSGSTDKPRTEPGKADPAPPVSTSIPTAPSDTQPPAASTNLPTAPSTSVPPLPATTIPAAPTEPSGGSSDTSTPVGTPAQKESTEAQPTPTSEILPTSEPTSTPSESYPEPPASPAPSHRPERVNTQLTSAGRHSSTPGPDA